MLKTFRRGYTKIAMIEGGTAMVIVEVSIAPATSGDATPNTAPPKERVRVAYAKDRG